MILAQLRLIELLVFCTTTVDCLFLKVALEVVLPSNRFTSEFPQPFGLVPILLSIWLVSLQECKLAISSTGY